MKQTLHIFQKDVRHLWPELSVSLLLLVALAWVTPQTWPTHAAEVAGSSFPWLFPVLAGLVKFLIVVNWAVLLSRLVHDEPLVGDRQFWITRPYTWYGLLAAKLLFLFALLLLPLVVEQVLLMHVAGLYPLSNVWPLAKNTLAVFAIVFLPLLAIAAVTATFVRYMLSVLAGLIYFVAVTVVLALLLENKAGAPGMGYVELTLLMLVPLVALLLQYARRRTAVTRTMLLALPLVLLLLVVLTPADALNRHHYAQTLGGQLQFDGDPNAQPPQTQGELFLFKDKATMRIPVTVSGVAAKDTGVGERVQVTIDGADGLHYVSGWVPWSNALSGTRPENVVEFPLPKAVEAQVAGKPVALHLIVAGNLLEAAPVYNVTASGQRFPLPHGGQCRVGGNGGTPLACAFPFNTPRALGLEADTQASCSGDATQPGAQARLRAHAFLRPSTGLPSLDGVVFSPVFFQAFGPMQQMVPTALCAGGQVRAEEFEAVAHGSMRLDVPAIDLGPYAMRQSSSHAPSAPVDSE